MDSAKTTAGTGEMRLPLELQATGMHKWVSCDGQIYLTCEACGREARIHYQWFADPASRPESACANCGAKLENIVRHLEHCEYKCLDCENNFSLMATGFEEVSCSICGSHDLEQLSGNIVPPFPPTFDQVAPPTVTPWGVSQDNDFSQIHREVGMMNDWPDFSSHLLLNIRFCNRLRMKNAYEGDSNCLQIVNMEANLYLEHCKRTSSFGSGLRSLALFEYLATFPHKNKGCYGDYVVALVSHVLLVRFSESQIEHDGGRPTLRAEAVARVRAALASAEEQAAQDPRELEKVAKYEVLLSQLLWIGEATKDQLVEAVTVANRALERGLLHPDGAEAFRVERAMALTNLPDASPELLDEAIEILEKRSAAPDPALDRRGPMSMRASYLFNLGVLYTNRHRPEDAVRCLEAATRLAESELVDAGSAEMLAERAGPYVPFFDALASARVCCNRPREALAAFEALRGAVVRISTSEELRRVTAVRATIKLLERLERRKNPDYRSDQPVTFASPDMEKELERLRKPLLNSQTAVLYYGVSRGQVTVLIIHYTPDESISVEGVQWPFPKGAHALFNGLLYGEPSPLREKRLLAGFRIGYKYLYAPIEERLRALGVKRIAICAAGLFSSVAFEALANHQRQNWFLAKEFEVLYIPSICVASNIAAYDPLEGRRLLTIAYSGNDLPELEAEIGAICEIWRGEHVILRGSDCNKLKVLNELSKGYEFIHFAGHGTFDHENPAESAFYFGEIDPEGRSDDAYRLTASDLLRVSLQRHPIVTLSACSSGITAYNAIHSLTGLPGSLFQIGARAIIGSRWPVSDRVACELMRKFYSFVAEGALPSRAFALAQTSLRETFPIEGWSAFGYLGLP